MNTNIPANPLTQAQIDAMPLNDILGTPTGFLVKPTAKAPRVSRVGMTPEELKAKRNEAQKLLRSTPEGKAYANEASKKSIALKKARIQAELDALKALVATIASPIPMSVEIIEEPTEVPLEEAIEEIIVEVVEAPVAKVKKPSTKKKQAMPADIEDALM